MKTFITTLIFLLFTATINAQTFSSSELTKAQWKTVFTDKVLRSFKINEPVHKVSHYQDASGKYYALFCEGDSATNQRVRFLLFKSGKNGLTKMRDEVQATRFNKDSSHHEEQIQFWYPYISFSDYDGDRLIDPVVVYGTQAFRGYSDGRIHILIFHNNQKITIKHQNGIHDFERNTKVDKAFYRLKPSLQKHVKDLMEKMVEDRDVIFPYGWQKALQQQKVYFDER